MTPRNKIVSSFAALLFGLEFVALYIGLNLTSASRGVVLLYVQPIVVALGVHFFDRGDRLTALKTIGLTAAFAGVGLAMLSRGAHSGGSFWGDFLCFASGVGWGLTVVVIKAGPLATAAAERVLLYQLAGSIPVLALFSIALGERLEAWPAALPLSAFLFTTFVVSFASYLAYFWLLNRYQASRVAAFTFLVPVLGVAFGAMLLDEPLSALLLSSLALVAAGIYLVNRG
ncbi:MAG: DMT family transporter [Hyphomicrobiaceae bacterium]|nr:MAG: DMT family transporter [Hyphomicrobiaceae bacterium]